MRPSKSIVGKGENACYQHFLLFPQCFLPFPRQISNFQSLLFCRLKNVSNLGWFKKLLFGNGSIHNTKQVTRVTMMQTAQDDMDQQYFHNVFYFSQHKFQFLSTYYFVVCKCFEFGPV